MKSINQFADEIAEQRLQKKMQQTGRGPENGGKKEENFELKKKRGITDFPEREYWGRKAKYLKSGISAYNKKKYKNRPATGRD